MAGAVGASLVAGAVGTVPSGATGSSPSSPSPVDVSDAVRYTPDGKVIGELLPPLAGQDDRTTNIDAPFPINFYGTRYPALCISTNGLVFPITSTASSCSNQYDKSVSQLALASQAPAIAALALDLAANRWLRNPQLLPPAEVTVTQVVASGGVATVTTATPHGYLANQYAQFGLVAGLRETTTSAQEGFGSSTVLSAPTPTTFTLATGIPDGTYEPFTPGRNVTFRDNAMDDVDALTLSGTTLTIDSDGSARYAVGQVVRLEGTGLPGIEGEDRHRDRRRRRVHRDRSRQRGRRRPGHAR
jgi:hypothetical protein